MAIRDNDGRLIVLGLGNLLNHDEGLGVHALNALQAYFRRNPRKYVVEPTLEFLDGGVLGLNLLPLVEEASHLLVLDAVNANKSPGEVIELKRDEIPMYSGIKLSDHQITFQEVLGLASFRGNLPGQLHLIGIQPEDISIGVGLSRVVSEKLDWMIECSVRILRAWGCVNSKNE